MTMEKFARAPCRRFLWIQFIAAVAVIVTVLSLTDIAFADPRGLVAEKSSTSSTSTAPRSTGATSHNENFGVSELSLLAFGTSRTAGKGLVNIDKDSFLNLLSPHSLNLAIPGGDVDFPSLCLSTLLGEQTFHAVIVESKPDAHLLPFLRRLLIRLRYRFPQAPIIFLNSIVPANFVHRTTQTTMYEWMIRQGITERKDDEVLKQRLMENTTSQDWGFDQSLFDNQEKVALTTTSNVHQLLFPPNWYSDDALQYLIQNLRYFNDSEMPEHSFSHFSVLGHETIADEVRQILSQLQQGHDSVLTSWNETRSWIGGEDHCDSWFLRGTLGELPLDDSSPAPSPAHHPMKVPRKTSGFCNWGPLGTASSSTCRGGAQGDLWCNVNVNNCKHCGGRWCTESDNETTMQRSMMKLQTNLTMNQFDKKGHKWALEVFQDQGGYICVTNPSDHPANLYVEHMKLAPERDQYPLTRATLLDSKNSSALSSVDLDPRFEYDLPFHAHVSITAFVGRIDSGASLNISFTPLERGMANPFRITGIIVTPTNEQIASSCYET